MLDNRLKSGEAEVQTMNDRWMKIIQTLKYRNDMCAQWYGISKDVSDTIWQHELAMQEVVSSWYSQRLNGVRTWNELCNASTGLNQSATGVLVALSGQGS